jgi:hypothetical protein
LLRSSWLVSECLSPRPRTMKAPWVKYLDRWPDAVYGDETSFLTANAWAGARSYARRTRSLSRSRGRRSQRIPVCALYCGSVTKNVSWARLCHSRKSPQTQGFSDQPDCSGSRRLTLGAHKAYDVNGFVDDLRDLNVTPQRSAFSVTLRRDSDSLQPFASSAEWLGAPNLRMNARCY